LKYLAQRVVAIIPTILVVSILIFVLMRVLPGDVATMILLGPDGSGTVNPQEVADLREKLSLDRPLPLQYLEWIGGMLRLDAGNSLWSRQPVFSELASRAPLTVQLGLMSTVISLVIALPTGILAAVKRGTWIDYSSRLFAIAGLSIPSFWVGVLIILALVTYFQWTPPLGYVGITQNPWVNFQQLIWAALSLGYIQAALVSRMMRSSLLEVMREDYVRTARAKGIRESRVVLMHAVKNAMLPVITIIGLGLAQIIGGTVVIETVFNLPGVGRFMVDSINHRDYPVVQTLTFLFAVVFATANLVVDFFYTWLDPRIRFS